MHNDIITFDDVTYSYDAESDKPCPVLENLSLSFEKGRFCAILGSNGSGKSTLAKLCNGLLKPTAGTVTVDGMTTGDDTHSFDIRKKVGLVFQNPDNQLVAATVEDDVAFGLENIGVPRPEMAVRVDEALAAVDMLEYKTRSPANLSGGQKQRVAIAGILAMRPECIVFDEPTAMLDPAGRKEVMRTVLSLIEKRGITVLLITHFMDEASLAERVIVLDGGAPVIDGEPRDVFMRVEELEKLGLDVPLPARLIYELNRRGCNLKRGAVTADECVEVLVEAFESEKKRCRY